MQSRKAIITNSVICCVLLVLGFFAVNLNVTNTYLTVDAPLTSGNRDSAEIGLMFIIDDPATINNLPTILSSLENAKLTATFFVTGTTMINDLALLNEIAAKFELGNHGFSHVALNVADKNLINEEILLCDTLIKNLANTKMRWFTPPQGLFNKHTLAVAKNLGYHTILPSDRPASIDWETADSNLVLSYATHNVKAGDIISLRPTTATMQSMSQIIAYFFAKNLKLTSLADLLA